MLETLLEVWHSLTNPELLIQLLSQVITGWYGYALLAGIVFAETGLLVGLFLPGDSLLFTVGVVVGAGQLDLVQICTVLMAAVIAGDQTGYFLGRKTGPAVFSRPDSRLFKQEYVRRTQAFFEKHGGKTIIYARFVPVVRTFTPFMAGVGRMPYGRFVGFSIAGGILWVVGLIVAGYYLGGIPIIRAHFEKVVIAIVVVSVLPLAIQFLSSRRAAS